MNLNLISAYVANFNAACLAKRHGDDDLFDAIMETSLCLTLALTVEEHTEAMKRIVVIINKKD